GVGNAAFNDMECEVFAGYHTIIFRTASSAVHPRFLAYVALSSYWRDQVRQLVSGVKVYSVTQKILRSTDVPLPSLKEQKDIVTTLDAVTAKIDRAVQILQQEIETLEDLKKSTIYEAVTKGLNPRVEMKNSGVDWIGEIPRHWQIRKLKYIASFGSGTTPDSGDYAY